MFGEAAGDSGLLKRCHVMQTSAHYSLKVLHHTITLILEIKRLLFPGPIRKVPVDSLFVINTLEKFEFSNHAGTNDYIAKSALIFFSSIFVKPLFYTFDLQMNNLCKKIKAGMG